MILLRSFLSGHIRIKRTLEYYDAGIGPRVPFGGGFGPTVSANFAIALGDYTTLSTTSSMPTGGLITRAGNAMLYDSTGKLTWAPNNILYPSNNFATGVLWSNNQITPTQDAAPPIGTSNGWSFALTGTAPYSTVGNFQVTQGVKYILSVYVKGVGSSIGKTGQLWFWYAQTATGPASSTTFTYTGDWQRISVSTVPTGSGTLLLRFDPEGTGGTATPGDVVQIFGAQLEQVTYQTTPSTYVATTSAAYYGPRFDYDPVTLQNKGLLVEGTRTNLQTYGTTPVTGWSAYGPNPTSGALATSPDGTANAPIINIGATAGQGWSGTTITSVSASTVYTTSFYVKASVGTQITLFMRYYNSGVSTGTTSKTFTISSGQGIGNGWYRFQNFEATPASTNQAQVTFLGVQSNDAWYLWGVQFELGSFASSFIPTISATTRAAETFSITGYVGKLVESFYIDEQTGGSWSANINASATSPLTISTPTFGWVTSLRAYTNAYAGDITTPSWIDNSGTTGNRMYYDSTGMLTYGPANLLQKSTDFSPPTWVNGSGMTLASGFSSPDGGSNGWKYTTTNTTSQQYNLQQGTIAAAVGQTITVSCYVKYGNSQWVAIGLYDTSWYLGCFDTINGVNGTVSSGATMGTPVNVGNGWYRISLTRTIISSNFYIGLFMRGSNSVTLTWTPNGTEYNYFFGSQAETVTYQTSPRAYIPTTSAAVYQPRYDYDPSVTPATPRGMLIEESRVNLATFSEQFDNAGWTKSSIAAFGSGSISNATTAPDGTQGADYVVAAAASATHAVYQSVTVVASTTYTVSFYAKKGAYTKVALYDIVNGRAGAWFNLDTGAFIGSGGAGYTSNAITSVGNGWYRCVMTFSASPTTFGFALIGYPDSATPNAAGFTYTGDAVSGVYLWGAQLEAGTFATSYIPTPTASPVTRASDVVKLTSAAFSSYWNASLGTLIAQATTFGQGGASPIPTLVNVSDGSTANYIRVNTSTTYGGRLFVAASGSTQVNSTTGSAPSNNQNFRIAAAWGASNFGVSFNGGNTNPTLSGNVPTVTQFGIGNWFAQSATFLNGYVQSFAYYNQRLPDATLKIKSVVGAPL